MCPRKSSEDMIAESFPSDCSPSGESDGIPSEEMKISYETMENKLMRKTLLLDIPNNLDRVELEKLSLVFDIITCRGDENAVADYILQQHLTIPAEKEQMMSASVADKMRKVQDEEFLSRAKEVVRRNMDNADFCKETFASEMCVSQSLLFKKIKSMTGMSLVVFIKSMRMEHALTLLADPTLSISEISEKTPAEKSQALADNLDSWAASVMKATASSVNEYIVVSNPMSDNPEFMLRSAESEGATENCFFFNDYMGDNYVADLTKSFSKSYTANGGNGAAVLYIEESGLLGNADKTTRLINQIKAWDAAGAQINGIVVDLPIGDATTKDEVTALFRSLASTGKLIRLNNVSFGSATPEFCKFVVGEYLSVIPAEKCAGIYFAGTGDLWKNATRTSVFGVVADALK